MEQIRGAWVFLCLVMVAPSFAQDGPRRAAPDLAGEWSVGPGGEGTATFTRRGRDLYDVRLTPTGGAPITVEAMLRGAALRMRTRPDEAPRSIGAVGVLAGRRRLPPGTQPQRRVSEYRLQETPRWFELELAGGTIEGAPERLRLMRQPDVIAPAEWEASEEILWATPDAEGTRVGSFEEVSVYTAAVAATSGVLHRIFTTSQTDAFYVVDYMAGRLGSAWASKRSSVRLGDRVPVGTIWIRDYGPLLLRPRTGGQRLLADIRYFRNPDTDDRVPARYGALRGLRVRPIDLQFEGGNYITDGDGRVFMTRIVVERNRGDQQRVEDELFRMGAKQVEWFDPLPAHDETGHIDMFAKLTGRSAVVVSSDAPDAANTAACDRAAARFRELGFTVRRLPMGRNPHLPETAPQLQTYSNSLFVGSTALVPQYGGRAGNKLADDETARRDQAALAVYREAGYSPVGIDLRTVIPGNGAIHCISMQVAR